MAGYGCEDCLGWGRTHYGCFVNFSCALSFITHMLMLTTTSPSAPHSLLTVHPCAAELPPRHPWVMSTPWRPSSNTAFLRGAGSATPNHLPCKFLLLQR